MAEQAPYQYICDYYELSHRKRAMFAQEASFTLSALAHVRGDSVLNVGCGPQFYDHMTHFGRPPIACVGIDISRHTIEFLERSRDPRLLQAKARARANGTRVELICADIFECAEQTAGRFDCIVGRGFFATFHGARFAGLMTLMHRALRPRGLLLKTTWHGPRRTAAETEKKLRYGFDTAAAPSPGELVADIEQVGFALRHEAIRTCDPATYGWDAVQVCVFEKLERRGAACAGETLAVPQPAPRGEADFSGPAERAPTAPGPQKQLRLKAG